MLSRVYVEKKPEFRVEAEQLRRELIDIPAVRRLHKVRVLNRYDVEGLSEEAFEQVLPIVFSEPQVDDVTFDLPQPKDGKGCVFAVEYLPGQFDQRADSASECIQLITQGERPLVANARVYVLEGPLEDSEVDAIKHYLINPVESREASLDVPETLRIDYPEPADVEVLHGFSTLDKAALAAFIDDRGLAMDLADITFAQQYFRAEGRDPSITEVKLIDTYWSDHCRHTTFGTVLTDVRNSKPSIASRLMMVSTSMCAIAASSPAVRMLTANPLSTSRQPLSLKHLPIVSTVG